MPISQRHNASFLEQQANSVIIVHDFLEKIGGAEYVLQAFLKKFKSNQIYTFSFKKIKTLQKYIINKKIKILIPRWLIQIYQKLPKFGKLFIIIINGLASYKLKILSKNQRIIINTSSFLPIQSFNAVIYYNIFPTWYLSSPKNYLTNMPFFFRFIYNILMLPYQNRIFKALSSQRFQIFVNSTFTAYMFYKFWQIHTEVFLPIFIYDSENNFSNHTFDSNLQTRQSKIKTRTKNNCFIYIGRLDAGKNLSQLVRNLSQNQCLLLVGDGELRQELQDLTRYLKKKVYFTGWIQHNQLASYIKNSKGLINLNTEAFGLTMFEALTYNKPVLGSIFSGLYDIAKNNIHFCTVRTFKLLDHQLSKLASLSEFDYSIIHNKLMQEYNISKFYEEIK